MNTTTEIIILTLSQMAFSFSRTLNVRYTSKDMVFWSIITSTIIKTTWLVSSFLGINALIKGNMVIASVYVISGIIGDYLSFKIRIK